MHSNDSTTKRQKLKAFVNELVSRFLRRPRFEVLVPRLQSSTFIQFMKAIEPVALVLAVAVFVNEFQDRDEDRIARAWQILATTQSTRSGTISALEFLNRQIAPDYLTWLPFIKERIALDGVELLVPPLSAVWEAKSKYDREIPSKCPGYSYLRKVQLADAILRDSTFACADLRHADLRRADLARVDFRRALLWRVDFRDAKLGNAKFEHADLWEADFRDAHFNIPPGFRIMRPPVEFPSISIPGKICGRNVVTWEDKMGNRQDEPAIGTLGNMVSFQHADLRRVDMRDVTGAFTDFRDADMRGADLRNADLSGSDFRGANLFAAKLQGTDLKSANLNGVQGVTCHQLREAKSWKQSYRDLTLECGSAVKDSDTGSRKERVDIFDFGVKHCE